MTTPIRIVHLSDLHLSTDERRNQDVILKALFEDIRKLHADGRSLDAVFFSGDLIAKGSFSPENISYAREGFIKPLLDAAKLTEAEFFIAPGNHDINLRAQSKSVNKLLNNIRDEPGAADYLTEATTTEFLPTGLEGFNAILNDLKGHKPVFTNSHYRAYKVSIKGVSVGICCFNTAWKASGRPNDQDYGELLISRKQTDELLLAVADCDLKLAIHHHPLSWIEQRDSYWVQRQLMNSFDAAFHGHNHTTDGIQLSSANEAVFVSNAGCLYQHREYFNGYSLIELDFTDPTWNLYAREYFEERKAFDVCTRYAAGGRSQYPAKFKNSAPSLAPIPSLEFITGVQENCAKHLLSSIVSEVAPKSLRSLFVEPPLAPISQRKVGTDISSGEGQAFTSLRTILATKKPTLFVGMKDAGKTTLLQEICLRALDFEALQRPMFCGYVDLNSSGNTRSSLLDSLVEFTKGAYRRQEFTKFLTDGLAVICLDNVNPHNVRQCAAIEELIQTYPKCRYYFSTLEEIISSISTENLPSFGLERDVFYLYPFGRRETRQLIANWFGDHATAATLKVDELLGSLGKFNIPRTPFLISALLWLREKHIQFEPVNQAEILDALIDGILEKLSESKKRTDLDSTNKRHFLGELALDLHVRKSDRLPLNELDKFAAEYFASRALPFSSSAFVEDLKNKGILININGHVRFKFDCIRAFFLSTKFSEPNGLLDEALTPAGFIELGEELDYFTGRTRNQNEILARCFDLIGEFKAEADLELDLSLFDEVSVHDSPLRAEHQESLAARINVMRPSPEQREQILDAVDERTERRPAVSVISSGEDLAAPPPIGGIPRFMAALQIASAILRNSELVDDINLKNKCYERLSNYWSEVMIAVLISADTLDENPQTLKSVQSLISLGQPELASYFLKIITPNVIISLVLESLGTTKLQQVIEGSLANAEYTVRKVLGTFLHVDLGLHGRFDRLDNLLREHANKRFVCEIIFAKLMQIYLFAKLHEREERDVKKLLGEALSATLSAKSKVERDALRQRAMVSIEQRRLRK